MKIDKKLIKELKDYLDEFNLSEIEYQDGTKKVKVAKNISGITNISAHKPNIPPKKEESGTKITSPIIGELTFVPLSSSLVFVSPGLCAVMLALDIKLLPTLIFLLPS